MDWAWAQARTLTSGEKLTLLAFAWESDNNGVTWIGPRRLMEQTGLQETGLRRCIAKLASAGMLARYRRTRKNGSEGSAFTVLNIPRAQPPDYDQYEFVVGEIIEGTNTQGLGGGLWATPCLQATPGVACGPPPDQLPNKQPKRAAPSKAPPKMSFRGKQATKGQAETVKNLIEAWNSETGQQRKLFNAGGMTGDAKKVLGAVMSHPEINEPQWMRTMQTLLANPWWNGPPTLGVMFGPGVVDDNLESPARGGARRDKPEPVREETTSPEYQRRMAAESVTERVHREQTGETVPSEEIKPLLIAMERRKRELGRELTSEECEQVGREVHERFSRARA
jgi:hypothetical protein